MLHWVEMWTSMPVRRAYMMAAMSETITASTPSSLARSMVSCMACISSS